MDTLEGSHIAVVEDDVLQAHVIQRILEKWGARVSLIDSPGSFAPVIEGEVKPDLVLMDVDLGATAAEDGIDLARRLLETRDIPIVLHTVHDNPEIIERAAGLPIRGFVVKNTGETVLRMALVTAMRLFASRRELEHANRRLALALSAARLGLVEVNLEAQRIDWNDRVYEMHGVHEGDFDGSLDGWERFVHPDDVGRTRDVFKACIADGETRRFDHRVRRPDGQVRYLEGTIGGIPDDDGTLRRVISIFHDRTEVHQSHRAVQQLAEERQRLLRETHHRTKNHLMIVDALVGFAEADHGVDLARVRRQIGAVQRVHELLHRDGAGLDIRADELLGTITDSVASAAGNRAIDVEQAIEPIHLPVATAVPLGLIVNELVTNAFKHGLKGLDRGTVTVSLVRAHGGCTLTVANTGHPLPAGISTEETAGLDLVRGLVDQLDGTLAIERSPITTFRVSIPLTGRG